MASLIPGYNYDIFISYRQKDNKHDGWVTEFVENLKGELESTFKEEISVYFDVNPHDGLLETHDVNASLKEKLKCLVFIPIISRTYCDPKSFAWEHEFKAFVDQASRDQFGLKVKLPGGNVASRVLPIRIYDLNIADFKFCETVLGGVLRGVEFIYSEPGVNRPLKPDDDEKMNLNKTKYRNQINKVGNAIQEIISGLMIEPVTPANERIQNTEQVKDFYQQEHHPGKENPSKFSTAKLLLGVTTLAILIIAAVLIYPKIFKRDTLERLRASGERISVAVMPFQNLTNDTLLNVWQNGIQNILITSLSNSEELRVKSLELITSLLQNNGIKNLDSFSPSVANAISQKLDANIFIYGSITQEGSIIHISAQLCDTRAGDILKSFPIDGTADEIIPTIDTLASMLKNYLVVSKLEKDLEKGTYSSSWAEYTEYSTTSSPEAYRYYIKAINAMYYSDNKNVFNWISKSVSLDSTFQAASHLLMTLYVINGKYDAAKILCDKFYRKRDQMTPIQQLTWDWANAWLNDTPNEEIKYIRQIMELDDQDPNAIRNMGDKYFELNEFEKAIPEYKKALKIFDKLGMKPTVPWNYYRLGISYHKTGRYRKEKGLYVKAIQDFPYDNNMIYRKAILELSQGDTVAANEYIEKYVSYRNTNKASDADITTSLATIYSEAGLLDKAEKYYRKALSLSPESSGRMNTLAYFLIDKDRDIKEGLQLADTALKINPKSYSYLHTKGWALYKLGKYQEAKDLLQASWDLRKKNAIYNHDAYAHLDSAKTAVANLKQ
jgi:tetratricopeptide (TPR) repeat protein